MIEKFLNQHDTRPESVENNIFNRIDRYDQTNAFTHARDFIYLYQNTESILKNIPILIACSDNGPDYRLNSPRVRFAIGSIWLYLKLDMLIFYELAPY